MSICDIYDMQDSLQEPTQALAPVALKSESEPKEPPMAPIEPKDPDAACELPASGSAAALDQGETEVTPSPTKLPVFDSDSEEGSNSEGSISEGSNSEGSNSEGSECSDCEEGSDSEGSQCSGFTLPEIQGAPPMPYSVGRPPARGFFIAGKALLEEADNLEKRIKTLQNKKRELIEKGEDYVTNGKAWDAQLKIKVYKKYKQAKAKIN